MKTKIFITTAVSASDSILRILCKMGNYNFEKAKFVNKWAIENKLSELENVIIPTDGGLYRFNVMRHFNKNLDLSMYKFLINFRDPRDRLCNMYHWVSIHPAPSLSTKEFKNRMEETNELGIDKWVLNKSKLDDYDNLLWLLDNLENDNYCVNTYAKLCLNFDDFIQVYSDFMNVPLTNEILDKLESERIENLENNEKWIGNKWAGSDTLPGRYKRELKPETIEILNKRFEPILRKMAKYDFDYAHLYLEGL